MLRKTVIALVVILPGCGGVMTQHATIGQLSNDKAPLTDVPLPKVSHQDVRNEYRSLLETVDNKALKKQIEEAGGKADVK